MIAAVVYEPGGPEVLRLEERPIPQAQPDWVVVRVRAFGLNRGEAMTRAGHSGGLVKFPRVLGIECVGEVDGQTVIACVGGMGRDYDGGYEEYALLPVTQVIPVRTRLSWTELGAVPETFGTAWGALDQLKLQAGQTLLIRGGTSSVGMAAITLAKARGIHTIATTRQETKRPALLANGADHVLIDDGGIAGRVREIVPAGADGLLELVGPIAMLDSMRGLRRGAIASQTGILEGTWDETQARAIAQDLGIEYQRFGSTMVINRTSYGTIFQEIIDGIERGTYHLNLDRTFPLAEIVESHRYMESNQACGKIVVLP